MSSAKLTFFHQQTILRHVCADVHPNRRRQGLPWMDLATAPSAGHRRIQNDGGGPKMIAVDREVS